MDKKCIWCFKMVPEVSFSKAAHTIPNSVGGKRKCKNVCNDCNEYFGYKSRENGMPSIEESIKELLNISRHIFSEKCPQFNTTFKSIFFDCNIESRKISLKKEGDKLNNKCYHEKFMRFFNRGIYKIFLEENERINGNSHDRKFDFIRKYARNNEGNLPVFYYRRKKGYTIAQTDKWILDPSSIFEYNCGLSNDELKKYREGTESFNNTINEINQYHGYELLPENMGKLPMDYLYKNVNFYEFEIYSHVFGIALVESYDISLNDYIKWSKKIKDKMFEEIKVINYFNDIDWGLTFFND